MILQRKHFMLQQKQIQKLRKYCYKHNCTQSEAMRRGLDLLIKTEYKN